MVGIAGIQEVLALLVVHSLLLVNNLLFYLQIKTHKLHLLFQTPPPHNIGGTVATHVRDEHPTGKNNFEI